MLYYERFNAKQQEMFNQLVTALSVGHKPVQDTSSRVLDSNEFEDRAHLHHVSAYQHDLNRQERFSASTSNAVKFLSS